MTNYEVINWEDILNRNILFQGANSTKVKHYIREYITELTEKDFKVFLLDSFWSPRKYSRYQSSRYRREIERRYHIKLSADDFLKSENIFRYMDEKEINIMKVKSIAGYMSAAELFPVIISKINEDIENDTAYILINDFILEHLQHGEFLDLYMGMNKEQIKFFVFNEEEEIPESLAAIIDAEIEI
ncbi:hypothetical protein [Sporosalibacterium faouarense]|uniref:hypothetical protein n=1 Tax=Sporosalibacterium faouarense TaxID=516123 RepID=UPI00141D523E|nr:hypothetical protein [Sporosalibacterium faouarense]MTI47486.1 hypothetical protein [Bacillota bacterium]